ncbi:hypothetical protein PENVUL_c013G04564 [Penicillium vulpinum]|uniref:Uncharacterized protein n=1 Tax=Penicillium vulpinum TaxID=29845 RepID=A0A1V6S0A6_9EURO|nr:hypothetical protein PENVUL_c013G04564 [Penicillium vulpinum]
MPRATQSATNSDMQSQMGATSPYQDLPRQRAEGRNGSIDRLPRQKQLSFLACHSPLWLIGKLRQSLALQRTAHI